jgi:hypothetical protein
VGGKISFFFYLFIELRFTYALNYFVGLVITAAAFVVAVVTEMRQKKPRLVK